MDVNLSTWDYYQKDFIDPLYAPYQKKWVKTRDIGPDGVEYEQDCPVHAWTEKEGYFNGLVNPAGVRKNWGKMFQLKHSTFSCPFGYVKGEDNYCFEAEPEFEPVFYTPKAFLPRRRYWNTYAPPNEGFRKTTDSFDFRSVNPNTGRYSKTKSSPNSSFNYYGSQPTPSSYLV